jgi:hypothetical protein
MIGPVIGSNNLDAAFKPAEAQSACDPVGFDSVPGGVTYVSL